MVYGRRPLGLTASYNTSTSAFPVSVPPRPAHRTAVTFGCSIQGSRTSGPTEFTITIVLLLFAATAWTSASPLFHAVKLFLWDGRTLSFLERNGGKRPRTYLLRCHPQECILRQSRTARRRLPRPAVRRRNSRRQYRSHRKTKRRKCGPCVREPVLPRMAVQRFAISGIVRVTTKSRQRRDTHRDQVRKPCSAAQR
jgi:hypothetical protein